jgi:hypothetical protein
MRKLLFICITLLVASASLTANNFDKEIRGNWYYDMSMPIFGELLGVSIKGTTNYMFNHKANGIIEIGFKSKLKEANLENIFTIFIMQKWDIKDNMLYEEIIQATIIENKELLEKNPELKVLKKLITAAYTKGMGETVEIISLTKNKLIIESEGLQIISIRKRPYNIKFINNTK